MKTTLIGLILLIALIIVQPVSAQRTGEKKAATGRRYYSVSVKLRTGKRINGELASVSADSLVMLDKKSKWAARAFGYGEIESIGIHKKGAGGLGAVVGGLVGAGVGALIGRGNGEGEVALAEVMVGGLGLLLGVTIGGTVGVINKTHLIHGEQEKFQLFVEKISSSLKPGSFIQVTLNTGEKIDRMKVEKSDGEKVTGFLIMQYGGQYLVYSTARTIMKADIGASLKTAAVFGAIKKGSAITLTLMNGEKIEKLKVEEIDGEKIAGTQIARDVTHQFVYTPRTILIADIEVIRKL